MYVHARIIDNAQLSHDKNAYVYLFMLTYIHTYILTYIHTYNARQFHLTSQVKTHATLSIYNILFSFSIQGTVSIYGIFFSFSLYCIFSVYSIFISFSIYGSVFPSYTSPRKWTLPQICTSILLRALCTTRVYAVIRTYSPLTYHARRTSASGCALVWRVCCLCDDDIAATMLGVLLLQHAECIVLSVLLLQHADCPQ